MGENRTEIGFASLWKIFRRSWIIMLAVAIVATIAAGALMWKFHESEYTASVKIWVFRNRTPVSDSEADDNRTEGDVVYENLLIDYYNTRVSKDLLQDCMEVLKTNAVLSRTLETYRNNPSVTNVPTEKELSKMMKLSIVNDTRLLKLSITADSPEEAMNLANLLSKEFQRYFNDVLMKGQSYIQIADPAILPENESNPISMIKIALIGVLAAVMVYAVALIRYLTDDKITSPEDVKQYMGLNILGAIPTQQNMSTVKWQIYSADEENKTST